MKYFVFFTKLNIIFHFISYINKYSRWLFVTYENSHYICHIIFIDFIYSLCYHNLNTNVEKNSTIFYKIITSILMTLERCFYEF